MLEHSRALFQGEFPRHSAESMGPICYATRCLLAQMATIDFEESPRFSGHSPYRQSSNPDRFRQISASHARRHDDDNSLIAAGMSGFASDSA